MKKNLLIIDPIIERRIVTTDRMLMEQYRVEGVDNIAIAQGRMSEKHYDLVILQSNYDLIAEQSFFSFLQSDPLLKWTPVLVVSGKNDIELKTKYFEMGAFDYLHSEQNHEELSLRITNLLKRSNSFEEMAFRDALTKAYNRRYFEQQIVHELHRAQRASYPISLAFIDADRFKSINDTYGHHVGDLVLIGLSALLAQAETSKHIVARYGGEEFVIVLPELDIENAFNVVNGLLEKAHQQPLARTQDRDLFVTFSAGICEWSTGMSIEEWIKRADDAAYEAKKQGRDRVILDSYHTPLAANELLEPSVIWTENSSFAAYITEHLENIQVISERGSEESFPDYADLYIFQMNQKTFNTIERLRKEAPKCKTIVISESLNEQDMLRCLKYGIDHYFVGQEISIDLLLSIKRLLDIY